MGAILFSREAGACGDGRRVDQLDGNARQLRDHRHLHPCGDRCRIRLRLLVLGTRQRHQAFRLPGRVYGLGRRPDQGLAGPVQRYPGRRCHERELRQGEPGPRLCAHRGAAGYADQERHPRRSERQPAFGHGRRRAHRRAPRRAGAGEAAARRTPDDRRGAGRSRKSARDGARHRLKGQPAARFDQRHPRRQPSGAEPDPAQHRGLLCRARSQRPRLGQASRVSLPGGRSDRPGRNKRSPNSPKTPTSSSQSSILPR